jgi:hypothetical protein
MGETIQKRDAAPDNFIFLDIEEVFLKAVQ